MAGTGEGRCSLASAQKVEIERLRTENKGLLAVALHSIVIRSHFSN